MENAAQDARPREKKKYTTQEVFDECSWETVDCDEQPDGNLHIVCGLDGNAIEIPLADIFRSMGIEPELLLEFLKEKVEK